MLRKRFRVLCNVFQKTALQQSDVAVPLDKAAQQAVERVPLDLRFLVLAVCHGLQKAAHAAHTVFALLDAVEILLGNRYGKDQSGCFPKN